MTSDTPIQQLAKTKLTVNSAVVFAIIVQTATIIWWASHVQSQVSQNAADIAQLKSVCCVVDRQQLDDVLQTRDVKIDSLNQQFADFRLETRAALQRIEKKI